MALNLLAPYLMTTASDLEKDEEGFCLGFHDSDGPAASDRATNMAKPVNWANMPTGNNAITTLNDRHDIQTSAQAGSGAVIECIDCHNPHAATSALPYILDPDTTSADTHVVGTNWYVAAYQTAGNTLSEFCLDCHDGTFAAGNTTVFLGRPMHYEKGTLTPIPIAPGGFVYSLTDATGNDPLVSGGYWCDTCHDRSSMETKSNCYACHFHGDSF